MSKKAFFTSLSALALTALIMMPHAASADRDGDRRYQGRNVSNGRDMNRNDHRGRNDKGPDRFDLRGKYDHKYNNTHHRSNYQPNYVVQHHHYQPPRYYPVQRPPRVVHYRYPQQNIFIGRRVTYHHAPPVHVVRYLQPAPYGYYYSMHNNDVLVVRQQDNVIEQVISLLFGQ